MNELLHWLQQQAHYPKVFWKDRDRNQERAAVGSFKEFDLPTVYDDSLFGGMRFSRLGKRDPIWNDFPDALFFQPQWERFQEETSLFGSAPLLTLKERRDTPNLEEWIKLVNKALSEKELEKVVLGRRTTLIFEEEIDPYALLDALREQSQRATFFLFQPSKECTFLGATPEKLYRRRGLSLTTEALAGTRPLGLEEELMSNPKERHEFNIVSQTLQETLRPHCSELLLGDVGVVKTSTVQHLYQKISGNLKETNSDRTLLSLLHPTPAIGGKPREKALHFLAEHESFDRGWYAGPLGWVSPFESDFAVAIRSALVRKNELHLFAAAGIVEGSNPLKEWDELENKISQFVRITHATRHRP